MVEVKGELPFKSPFIRSGTDKGRIRNPDTAHEVYNTILEGLSYRGKSQKRKKVEITKLFVGQGDNDFLIRQAAKKVKVEELQRIDQLTKLGIKGAFEPTLTTELENLEKGDTKSLGIIKFDLDYFSWVNDVLEAHQLGDLYLESAGSLIRKMMRPQDSSFRVGGDELAVITRDSFSDKSFLNIVDRLHKNLDEQILITTLKTVVNSKREISDKNGKKEREGTIAVRQFLNGLLKLRDNTDGRKTHFLTHGRGGHDVKQEFLKRLESVNMERYEQYLADNRVKSELTPDEFESRIYIENQARNDITYILSNLGVSTAGIFLIKGNQPSYHDVTVRLEEIGYELKRKGGRQYSVETGLPKKSF